MTFLTYTDYLQVVCAFGALFVVTLGGAIILAIRRLP